MKTARSLGMLSLIVAICSSSAFAAQYAEDSHRGSSFVVAGILLIVVSTLRRKRRHQ